MAPEGEPVWIEVQGGTGGRRGGIDGEHGYKTEQGELVGRALHCVVFGCKGIGEVEKQILGAFGGLTTARTVLYLIDPDDRDSLVGHGLGDSEGNVGSEASSRAMGENDEGPAFFGRLYPFRDSQRQADFLLSRDGEGGAGNFELPALFEIRSGTVLENG